MKNIREAVRREMIVMCDDVANGTKDFWGCDGYTRLSEAQVHISGPLQEFAGYMFKAIYVDENIGNMSWFIWTFKKSISEGMRNYFES